MELKLLFGHAENGSAIAKMAIDDGDPVDFDYVKLVKLLFDDPAITVTAEVAQSYNNAQKQRLNELVGKIVLTARGQANETQTDSMDKTAPV